jgi:hypothetical protein
MPWWCSAISASPVNPPQHNLEFREQLMEQLIERAQGRRQRQAATTFPDLTAQLRRAHLIVKLPVQQRCAYCYSLGKKDSKSSYGCSVCHEALHADCFFVRHENLDAEE